MRPAPAVLGSLIWLAAVPACAPIHTKLVYQDHELGRTQKLGGVKGINWHGTVSPRADGMDITVDGDRSCSAVDERRVSRTTHEVRTADPLVTTLLVTMGVGFGATGGFLLYDNRSGVDPTTRAWDGVTPDVGRLTGASFAVAGGTLLLGAIVSGIRARDSERGPEEIVERHPVAEPVACGSAKATSLQLAAEWEIDHAKHHAPLGSIAAGTKLALPWSAIPGEVLDGPNWPHAIAIVVNGPDGRIKLGDVATDGGRKDLVARAWADVEAHPTADGYEALAARMPERDPAEALARARTLRLAAIQTAFTSGDLTRAEAELAGLRAHHADAAEIPALAAELERRQTALRVDQAWKRATDALTAAIDPAAEPIAFETATTELAAARDLAAQDPRGADMAAQLDRARTDRVAAALRDTAAATRAKDFARGRTQLAVARALRPEDARVTRAQSSLDVAEIAALRQQARQHARARDYAAAVASLDAAVLIAPGDKALAREHEQMVRREAASRPHDAVSSGAVASATGAVAASASPATPPAATGPGTSATAASTTSAATTPAAQPTTAPASTTSPAVATTTTTTATTTIATSHPSTPSTPSTPSARTPAASSAPGSRATTSPATASASTASASTAGRSPPANPSQTRAIAAVEPGHVPGVESKPATPPPPARSFALARVSYKLPRPIEHALDLVEVPDGCLARFGRGRDGSLRVQVRCPKAVVVVGTRGTDVRASCHAAGCGDCTGMLHDILAIPSRTRSSVEESCADPTH